MDLDQTQAISFEEDELDEPSTDKKIIGYLKVFNQKGINETKFPLYEGDNLIGRDKDCEICIPIKAISKQHACIEASSNGCFIYDKASKNKTRRGKMFLVPQTRYEMRADDLFTFGDVTSVFLHETKVENETCGGSETGSETGSESMLPQEPSYGNGSGSVANGTSVDTATTDSQVTAVSADIIVEQCSDGSDSDAMVDLFQPTQCYLGKSSPEYMGCPENGNTSVNDPSDSREKTVNESGLCGVLVQESPAIGHPSSSFRADDSGFIAPTQAYILESDTEEDAAIENQLNHTDGATPKSLKKALEERVATTPVANMSMDTMNVTDNETQIFDQPPTLFLDATPSPVAPKKPTNHDDRVLPKMMPYNFTATEDIATQVFGDDSDGSGTLESTDRDNMATHGNNNSQNIENEGNLSNKSPVASQSVQIFPSTLVMDSENSPLECEIVKGSKFFGADCQDRGNANLRNVEPHRVEPAGVIESTQVHDISPTQVQDTLPTQVHGISPTQVQDISPTQVQDISPTQVHGISPTQAHDISPTQAHDISPTQAHDISLTQVHGISPTQVQDISPTQAQDISPTQVHGISPTQVHGISPTQAQDISPTQVHGISQTQDQDISPTQIQEIEATEVQEMSATQNLDLLPTQVSVAPTLPQRTTYIDDRMPNKETSSNAVKSPPNNSLIMTKIPVDENKVKPTAGEIEPTQAYGEIEPTQAYGEIEPTQAYGEIEPTQAYGEIEPTQASGEIEPTQAYGKIEPTQASGEIQPTQGYGEIEPSRAYGELETTQTSVEIEPTQDHSEIEPTQAYSDSERTQVHGEIKCREVDVDSPVAKSTQVSIEKHGKVCVVKPRILDENKKFLPLGDELGKDVGKEIPTVSVEESKVPKRSGRSRSLLPEQEVRQTRANRRSVPVPVAEMEHGNVTVSLKKGTRQNIAESKDRSDGIKPAVVTTAKTNVSSTVTSGESSAVMTKLTSRMSRRSVRRKNIDDTSDDVMKEGELFDINTTLSKVKTSRRSATKNKDDSSDDVMKEDAPSINTTLTRVKTSRRSVIKNKDDSSDDVMKGDAPSIDTTLTRVKTSRRSIATKKDKCGPEDVATKLDDKCELDIVTRGQRRRVMGDKNTDDVASGATKEDLVLSNDSTVSKLPRTRRRIVASNMKIDVKSEAVTDDDACEVDLAHPTQVTSRRRGRQPTDHVKGIVKSTRSMKRTNHMTEEGSASDLCDIDPKTDVSEATQKLPVKQRTRKGKAAVTQNVTMGSVDISESNHDDNKNKKICLDEDESSVRDVRNLSTGPHERFTEGTSKSEESVETNLTFSITKPTFTEEDKKNPLPKKVTRHSLAEHPVDDVKRVADTNTRVLPEMSLVKKSRRHTITGKDLSTESLGRNASSAESDNKRISALQEKPITQGKLRTSKRAGTRKQAEEPPTTTKGKKLLESYMDCIQDSMKSEQTNEMGSPVNKRKRRSDMPAEASGSPPVSKKITTHSSDLTDHSLRTVPSAQVKVLFTGVVDEDGQKIVVELGGKMAQSVFECTHLITDKVRRTVKFLCCVARGVPIVTYTWLKKCKTAKRFIDHTSFILHDNDTEKQLDFRLQESLNRAANGPLLVGYRLHVTRSVRPEPTQMKDILQCAGAEYMNAMPRKATENTIVVSCPEDEAACKNVVSLGVPVVSAEFVLTGVLKQQILTDPIPSIQSGTSKPFPE